MNMHLSLPSTRRPLAALLLLLLLAGCAPAVPSTAAAANPTPVQATQTTASPLETAASLPSGWETHTDPRLKYALSYPPGLEVTSNGDYSWTLRLPPASPDQPAPSFLYVSVIPADFQSTGGDIYNYSTAETERLLDTPVGESLSLHTGTESGFTYTRLPDVTLNGQAAQRYENTQPWEFPSGTKEIRYYLQTPAFTYLLGAYVTEGGAEAITEQLFNQIVATFQVLP